MKFKGNHITLKSKPVWLLHCMAKMFGGFICLVRSNPVLHEYSIVLALKLDKKSLYDPGTFVSPGAYISDDQQHLCYASVLKYSPDLAAQSLLTYLAYLKNDFFGYHLDRAKFREKDYTELELQLALNGRLIGDEHMQFTKDTRYSGASEYWLVSEK